MIENPSGFCTPKNKIKWLRKQKMWPDPIIDDSAELPTFVYGKFYTLEFYKRSMREQHPMDTVNIRIAELPQRHQEPFRQWLIEQGHTQLTLDEKEPHAYAYVVDYQKWLRIGNHE